MNKKLKNALVALVFGVVIFAVTFFTKIQFAGVYVHLGDAFIFLMACFVPTSFALVTAALAGGLADLAAGAQVYLIATVIIKALMACWFMDEGKKILDARNLGGAAVASIIMVGGYYLAYALRFGDFGAPASFLLWNVVQAVCNFALFFVIAAVLDKFKVRERLMGQNEKKTENNG
ncbi:MAG: ECF transporter S component [Clostridia bacterium]